VELENEYLRTQRDSIMRMVALNDSLQREVNVVRTGLETEAVRLQDRIDQLEQQRGEAQLSVRRLRRKEDLQARLTQTFPEMAASQWGVTELFHEEEGIGIEYLLVPLWFSETFLIDHQNSLAYKTQVDTFRVLDNLRVQISTLQDSVFKLERDSRLAFDRGYREAFQRYEALNADYVDLLRKPRFSLGVPGGLVTLVGSLGAGFVAGTVVK
jgi:hypothetical protein